MIIFFDFFEILNNRVIADVLFNTDHKMMGYGTTNNLEEAEANAKLIAEAPKTKEQHDKMYEALKLAKNIIHAQMGKGLILSTYEYNAMFDCLNEIES